MTETEEPKRTPLYETHLTLGARMAPFGGWEMPIQYAGILEESRAVRSRAGLFDVSHMGRVNISGPDATAFLDSVFSSDVPGLRLGRARYGVICNERGGIIDDCILYRRADDRFLLVPNAGNTTAVLDWLARQTRTGAGVAIEEVTAAFAMIALQGPEATEMLSEFTHLDLASVRPFRAVEAEVDGAPSLLARTGYTGEDGFEIILPSDRVVALWQRLVGQGASPAGLGARDVLRLEAGLLLHGNDMDDTMNPYEAGLDRFVDPDRDGYVPGKALRRIRDDGPSRVLVGFTMLGRGIARHGQRILDGSDEIGTVTSGSVSPTLDTNIGMGYVPTGFSAPGSRLTIDVRGRTVEAEVTALPFYSRKKGR
jgi:aminomethyltransferase